MNKIKVFHIISRLNIGGPTKLLISLANQCANDFEMVVLTGKEVENEGALQPNCRVIQINGLEPGASKRQTFQAYNQVKLILRKEKPHIVHTHQAKAGLIGRVAAYRTQINIRIHTFHGHVFKGYFSFFKSKIIQFIEKVLAKISTGIIVISPSIEHDITKVYKIAPKQKTHLIHIGISAFSPNCLEKDKNRSAYSLPQDKTIYAFIGRLAPIKNPLLFLQLTKHFKNTPNIHFLLVGDGPLKETCSSYIKEHQLAQNITTLGWVLEVDNLLACINGLIMTSLNEGTPLMALEAMQAKIPVLSTPVGGVVDIIKHSENGFLCQDLQEFIQTINQINANQINLHEITNKAKKDIEINFGEERFYQNTLALYKKLIATF